MKTRIGIGIIGFIGLIGLICHWPLALSAQVGPYVNNSGVAITPPVMPYAAVATLATSSLGVQPGSLAAAFPQGMYLQNLGIACSANTFATDYDGTAITVWPDLSGNGNNLQCTSLSYQHNACEGVPGVYFPYGSGYATNANFLSNYAVNTNFTIFMVVRDTSPSGGATPNRTDWLFSVGPSGGVGSFRWADYNGGAGNMPGNEIVCSAALNLSCGGMMAGNVDIMAISYNGQYYSYWQNGIQEFDGRYGDAQNSFPQTTGIGNSGSLYLGGLPIPQGNFNGYVSMLLVYTNCLTPTQVQQNNSALCSAYGLNENVIMLSGDSITEANQSTAGTNLTAFLVDAFPGWIIANCGRPGMNSSNQNNYAYDWAPNLSQFTGHKIDVFMEQVNDNGAGLSPSTTLTNYILHASIDHTNNVQCVLCTIPSYNAGDLNGTRTNFNSLLRNSWRGVSDNICDYAAVAAVGAQGACSNSTLFSPSDLTHELPPGYQDMSNVLVQSIQQLLYPTANQFGVLYPSNTFNLALYTNLISNFGTLVIYTNNGANSGAMRIYNNNGSFVLSPGA